MKAVVVCCIEKTREKRDMKRGNETSMQVNPKGQSAMLQKIMKQTYAIVTVGIVFLILFVGLNIASNNSMKEQVQNVQYLNQYRLGSKILTSAVQSYAVTGDASYQDAYNKELNEDKNRDIAWAGLKKNHLKSNEWTELNKISQMSQGLVPLEEQAMEAVQSGDTQSAQSLVFGSEYEDTVQQISADTDTCIKNIENRMNKKQTVLNFAMMISMVLFVISFILIVRQIQKVMRFSHKELLRPIVKVSEMLKELARGNFQTTTDLKEDESEVGIMVAAIQFMNQNFSKMITEISTVLGKMGEGNYNVQLNEQYVGEFVAIKDSMTKIIADTRHTLTTIRTAANEIDGGSEQLAQAASDLAEGCTVQANSVSEVSEAIDQVAKMMEEKTLEAQETVQISGNAGQVLVESNKKMQELKDAIGEINTCSEEIRTIIGVIEDIASQTNLLSLNASIEAARAGEAGKGFAVVAEQVKNLAEQSTQAAGQTTQLIQSTIDAVAKGMAISDEAAENMSQVMVGAKEATDKMSQMAEAMKQEAQSLSSINENVSKVAEIVDNNSAASEETAAVSQEQTAQVQTMVQMMDRFEI